MDEYELLQTMRAEIQAEHTLLSNRMAWYATSQSFLMTTYAIAWGQDHNIAWNTFFRHGIPPLGIALSICASLGIFAAVQVQAQIIKSQTKLLTIMAERFAVAKDAGAQEKLEYYSGTTCAGRPSKTSSHWKAMIPQCLVPVIFLVTWVVAWIVSK